MGSTLGAAPAGIVATQWLDTEDRQVVVEAFEREFRQTDGPLEFSGDHSSCDPGESSQDLRYKTLSRVNFYRAMAGVPAQVKLNSEYSAKAQAAALSMSAEGKLTHNPGDGFSCLSETVKQAAANSNLYLGRTGAKAIDGYVEDPGESNADVGHRATMLHPPTKEMGIGHVEGGADFYDSNVLWVFDEDVFESKTQIREEAGFVAWPARGFVPHDLVYPRWSFSIEGADFERSTVSVSVIPESAVLEVATPQVLAFSERPEVEIVSRSSVESAVPWSTIVWELPTLKDSASDLGPMFAAKPATDVTYRIDIRDVVLAGVERDYSYNVTVIGDRPAN